MENGTVSRRRALKYIGLLTGTVAGREFLDAWLPSSDLLAASGSDGLVTLPGMHHGAPVEISPAPYAPQFFTPQEFSVVEILAEMIIPTDETPGAKEAQVANYIDFVLFSAAEFRPALQESWTAGLALLGSGCASKFSCSFHEASSAQREELLTEMSLPERDPNAHHEGFSFFALVKEMTLEGFYTSRVGLIDVLEYQGRSYLSEFPGCTHPEHQS